MDNGINIKDNQLKNLIVLADNEVEFIQMLGRLRENRNRINLYIYSYSENHFRQRMNKIIDMEEVAVKYWEGASKRVDEFMQQQLEISGVVNWEEIYIREREFVSFKHIELLNHIINGDNKYEKVKAAFYARSGMLLLNPLSVCQMDHLKKLYKKMIDKFGEEGEDAFLREQLRWLGRKEEEIDSIIYESKLTAEERSRKEVCRIFDKVVGMPMKREDVIELKKGLKDNLLVLIQSCEESKEKQTIKSNIKKSDRSISRYDVDYLRQNCKLPYLLNVEKGEYTFYYADM